MSTPRQTQVSSLAESVVRLACIYSPVDGVRLAARLLQEHTPAEAEALAKDPQALLTALTSLDFSHKAETARLLLEAHDAAAATLKAHLAQTPGLQAAFEESLEKYYQAVVAARHVCARLPAPID